MKVSLQRTFFAGSFLLFLMTACELSAQMIGAVTKKEHERAVAAVLRETTPQFNEHARNNLFRRRCRICVNYYDHTCSHSTNVLRRTRRFAPVRKCTRSGRVYRRSQRCSSSRRSSCSRVRRSVSYRCK